MKLTRRNFLAASAATAAVAATSTVSSPAVLGADSKKKYRTALIGCGWWGNNIRNAAMKSGTIELVALCDVDRRQLDRTLARQKEMTDVVPKTFGDYREMLKEIQPEIVINATPDHWHALTTIAACEAGAHVYLEKPNSHTMDEGLPMIKAARDAKRIVQIGMHRRTAPHHISAMEFLKSGKVGKIGAIKAFVNYPWMPKSTPDEPVPEGLNWDFFCGPSKLVPFNPRMHPGGYRHFEEFSNGQISDWGTHWLDQVLWWAGDDVHPTAICAIGGRRIFDDNTTIPDSMHVVYKFDKFDLIWENRNYAGNPQERHNVGLYFYGSEGVLHLGWLDGWSFYPRGDFKVTPTEHVESVLDMPDHQNIANLWDDFIKSIESNTLPICDIEIGHHATSLALLAVLSLKLGRGIVWDGGKQTIPNDPEACKLLSREYRAPWQYPTV